MDGDEQKLGRGNDLSFLLEGELSYALCFVLDGTYVYLLASARARVRSDARKPQGAAESRSAASSASVSLP